MGEDSVKPFLDLPGGLGNLIGLDLQIKAHMIFK